MSTALYRRYRPETFDEVIGQEHVTDPLKAALERGRVNHAYLFSGPRGCGKTTSARILARALNCVEGPTPVPCGRCDSCAELATGGGGSLDVVEIDAASHNGVDDARDLRERAAFAPARDRYKVFILDEAHMVTTQGFNALLKLVEEPPEHVKFIFATTEPEKVIGTIRSRTHHYPFRLVPPDRLSAYLDELGRREGIAIGAGVLPLVVRAGGGSVRDSLSVLDQLMAGAGPDGVDYERAVALLGYTHAALLDDMVESLAAGDGAAVFRSVERIVESGHDPRRFVEDLLERFRDLIVIGQADAVAPALLPDVPADQLDRMRAQSRTLGPAELSRAADLVHSGLAEMTGATSPRLQLDLICARLLLTGSSSAVALQARVERVERRIGMAPTGSLPAGTQTSEVAPAPTPVQAPTAAPGRQAAPDREVPTGPGADASRSDRSDAGSAPRAGAGSGPSGGDADAMDEAMAAMSAIRQTQSDSPSDQPAAPSAAEGTAAEGAVVQDDAGRNPGTRASALRESTDREAGPQAQASGGGEAAPRESSASDRSAQTEAARHGGPAAESMAASAAPDGGSTVPGGSEIEAVRRAWPDILGELFGLRKIVWALVNEHATAHSLQDGTLRLAFRTPGLAQRFDRADYASPVAEAVRRQLGLHLAVAAITSDGPPPARPVAGGEHGGGSVPSARATTEAADSSGRGASSRKPGREPAADAGAPSAEASDTDAEDHWRPVAPPTADPADPWYTPGTAWASADPATPAASAPGAAIPASEVRTGIRVPGPEPVDGAPGTAEPAEARTAVPQDAAVSAQPSLARPGGGGWLDAPAPIVPPPEELAPEGDAALEHDLAEDDLLAEPPDDPWEESATPTPEAALRDERSAPRRDESVTAQASAGHEALDSGATASAASPGGVGEPASRSSGAATSVDYLGAYADLAADLAEESVPALASRATTTRGTAPRGSRIAAAQAERERAMDGVRQFFAGAVLASPGAEALTAAGSDRAAAHDRAAAAGAPSAATAPVQLSDHEEMTSDDDPEVSFRHRDAQTMVEELLGGVVIEEVDE